MNLTNSKCRNNWLHDFTIVDQRGNYVKEVCEKCHKIKIFKQLPGITANLYYLSYHLKNALPKQHPRFAKEYQK